jgi:formylglycine-generating enzyme required for sulfatase activity
MSGVRIQLSNMVAAMGALLAFAPAEGCSNSLPPNAEALIVIDTDLPAPAVAGRLRMDFFAEDGTWFDSRDISLPEAADWPASFSIWSADTGHDRRMLLRLRAYPEGVVRDYTGERFVDQGAAPPDGPGPDDVGPRLVRADGTDVSPAREPEPAATVDRLVLVHLRPRTRGRVRVTMRGACGGTMAMLSQTAPYQTPVLAEAQTCVDTEAVRVGLTDAPLEDDMSVPPALELGAFAADEPCDPSAPADPRAVCVPSGVFVLGSRAIIDVGPPYDAVPPRLAALHRFWIDRHEVTVGQMRRAVTAGLAVPNGGLSVNDGPLKDLGDQPGAGWCTWSTNPMGREDYALWCMSRDLALAYCHSLGGDLPTEAQWEYVATAAGRPAKTRFPWGDAPASCAMATYGRASPDMRQLTGFSGQCLGASPIGPQPIGSSPLDVTPLGIVDLAGGQSEIVRDVLASYASSCWAAHPVWDPLCTGDPLSIHVARGGSWYGGDYSLQGAARDATYTGIEGAGFRCVFDHAPGGS